MLKYFSILILVIFQFLPLNLCHSVPIQSTFKLNDERITNIRKTSENLKSKLSYEFDPCVNFLDFVCNKSTESRRLKYEQLATSELLAICESAIEKPTEAEVKLHNYMESCRNYKDDDIKEFLREADFLQSLGGSWPAFDENWNGDKFNLEYAIAEFQSLHVAPFIDEDIGIDPKTLEKFFYVDLEDFGSYKNDDHKEETLVALKNAGVENPENILNDAIKVERECEKIAKSTESSEFKVIETNFENLKKEIPEINWDKQIEIIYGKSISNDYPVRIKKSPERIRLVIQAVSKMEPKIVANYIMCQFINTLPSSSIKTKDERCLWYSLDVFQPVISGIFMRKFYSDQLRMELKDMITAMLEILARDFGLLDDEDDQDHDKTISEFIDTHYFPTRSDNEINKLYENTQIDSTKFLRTTYLLRAEKIKNSSDILTRKERLLELLTQQYPWIIFNKMRNSAVADTFTYLILEPLMDYVEIIIERRGMNEKFKACFANKYHNAINENQLRSLLTLQLFMRGYYHWMDKNKEFIDAQDDLLKEYDLTSEKVPFIRLLQLACGNKNHDIAELVTQAAFSNTKEFSDAFNCPVGSKFNPTDKCVI